MYKCGVKLKMNYHCLFLTTLLVLIVLLGKVSCQTGCSDGTCEGLCSSSEINACAVSGISGLNLRSAKTGATCGGSSPCAAPVDACASGWFICGADGDRSAITDALGQSDCSNLVGSYVSAMNHCSTRSGPTCTYSSNDLGCTNNVNCGSPLCCGNTCSIGVCTDALFPGATGSGGGGTCATATSSTGILCCKITPSLAPTPAPTFLPSPKPTASPTFPQPTFLPTTVPTPVPTLVPTAAPTKVPTAVPTPIPTTAAPTFTSGCSDGTCDGLCTLPNIQACKAAGIAGMSLRTGRSSDGATCGNFDNCASPADACAPGWFVCLADGTRTTMAQRLSSSECASLSGSYVVGMSQCSQPGSGTCTYSDGDVGCFADSFGTCSRPICCGDGCDTGNICDDAIYIDATRSTVGGGCQNVNVVDGVLCCRIEPSASPTVVPTVIPTFVPTFLPTKTPTTVPTFVPTYAPTTVPTAVPTVAPTRAPTVQPSLIPTRSPTLRPTFTPTTAQPTFSSGCSDGSCDGLCTFSDIQACKAPGISGLSLRAPRSQEGQTCGNNKNCASPADACADGWSVCLADGDRVTLAERLPRSACQGLSGEYVTGMGHCTALCSYLGNDLGCGASGSCSRPICCGNQCGFSSCRDAVYLSFTSISSNSFCGSVSSSIDGVLCCRNEPSPSPVQQPTASPTSISVSTRAGVSSDASGEIAGTILAVLFIVALLVLAWFYGSKYKNEIVPSDAPINTDLESRAFSGGVNVQSNNHNTISLSAISGIYNHRSSAVAPGDDGINELEGEWVESFHCDSAVVAEAEIETTPRDGAEPQTLPTAAALFIDEDGVELVQAYID